MNQWKTYVPSDLYSDGVLELSRFSLSSSEDCFDVLLFMAFTRDFTLRNRFASSASESRIPLS